MIKKLVVVILLLIMIDSVLALENKSIDYGYIIVKIENDVPIIINTSIVQKAFPNRIECDAIVEDEYPDDIKFYYNWYNNGLLLEEKSSVLYSIKNNDNITCQLTVQDQIQNGSSASMSIVVQGMTPITGFAILNPPDWISLPHDISDFLKHPYLFLAKKLFELF